jgi:phosphopantetheine binding protein
MEQGGRGGEHVTHDQSHASESELTGTERQLASIWAEVLSADRIAPTDTFLCLGGESISATLCLHRVRKLFNVDVSLDVVLSEATTLRSLAAVIDHTAPAGR